MPTYRMKLTMLSPVHVGSGEEIEPTEYLVRQEGTGDTAAFVLYAVDLPGLLSRLSDTQRQEFNEAADRRGGVFLRKLIARTADLERDLRWRCDCSEELFGLYRKGLEDDRAQLAVNLMTREGITGRPYLPGSSIKGALRTAWLDHKAAAYTGHANLQAIPERDFEPEVLGYRVHPQDRDKRPRNEIRADPLRAVRVGDARLCPDSNVIDRVVIYKPDRKAGQADPAGIQMFYDTTYSLLEDYAITAEGRLRIDERLATRDVREARNWAFAHCVAGGIDVRELLEACNAFYRPRLEGEIKRFPALRPDGEKLLGFVQAMKDNEALIRLGRFSHRECMTVARRGGEPAEWGTTRSLVNGMPLGWAKMALSVAGA